MKSRLPKGYGGGVNDMVKRAQEMQAKMEQAQAELEAMEFTSSVGGGVVEAVVSGKKEVTALHIKPEVVDPDDVEMLQDLIISAINEAMAQVEAKSEEDMQKIAAMDTQTSAFFSHYDPNMVEWFAKMVEERKQQHDSSKEKKNW